MSVICKIVLPGKVSWREMAFENVPRAGDFVSLPDVPDNRILRISHVLHEATEPHASSLPVSKLICEWADQ